MKNYEKSYLNHVAFLVKSIDDILEKFSFNKNLVSEINEYQTEGTKEVYIGGDKQKGRLLLIQTIGDGPYKKTLKKRDYGIHHIALDVVNVDNFLTNLSESGWLLHPKSIYFYNKNRQIWLCRPGIPVLIEIQENKLLSKACSFIKQLTFPFQEQKILDSLACSKLAQGPFAIMFENSSINLRSVFCQCTDIQI